MFIAEYITVVRHPKTVFSVFFPSLQANTKCLAHDRLLPNPFQFTIYQSPYNRPCIQQHWMFWWTPVNILINFNWFFYIYFKFIVPCIVIFYGINNICDNVQWNLFLCKSTLHVSGGTHAHHQEYNFNCIYSHWYNSYCKK